MKKLTAIGILFAVSLALFGQTKPDWMDDNLRNTKFSDNVYFTGFAYGEIPQGKTQQIVVAQIKTEAQADLSRKIRVQVSAKSQNSISAVSNNGRYDEQESFTNQSTAESNAEIVGIKTESYFDPKTKLVYAFAYLRINRLL